MINYGDCRKFIIFLLKIKRYILFPILINFIISFIKYIINKISYETVIDVFVKKNSYSEIEPPFGIGDFTCNSLILSNHGLKNFGIFDVNKLTSIISEIQNFETSIVDQSKLSNYRLNLMLNKDYWKIKNFKLCVIKELQPDSNDVCIICFNEFKDSCNKEDVIPYKNLKKAYGLSCCSIKYHNTCFKKAFKNGNSAMIITKRCICCKKKIKNSFEKDLNSLKCDIDFIIFEK